MQSCNSWVSYDVTEVTGGGGGLKHNIVIRVNRLFVLCISFVFGGKHLKFRIIFSLQYSIGINTFEVIDPPSDSLYNAIVKPKYILITRRLTA
jgi:hypothetical protein